MSKTDRLTAGQRLGFACVYCDRSFVPKDRAVPVAHPGAPEGVEVYAHDTCRPGGWADEQ